MNARLRRARPADLQALLALLRDAGLPTAGSVEADLVVAEAGDGSIAGCAGVQRYADAVLLRSLVVRPGWRGLGLGRRLVAAALEGASARRAFLLTTGAVDFFAGLGFRPIARGAADEAVRASVEFTTSCPQTAVCMVREMGGPAGSHGGRPVSGPPDGRG